MPPIKYRHMVSILLIIVIAVIGVLKRGGDNHGPQSRLSDNTSSYPCNDAQFLQDQQSFERGQITVDQFEDVCGTVTAVRQERQTRSGRHGYFDVQIANGGTIEIVSDLDEMNAPAWPWVKTGDSVYVQGRYYYDNSRSQGIDWTHHGTGNSWPHPGYVVVGNTEYQ